ncbi:MAG TPA: phosphoribosylglycinamide formyltransferase [Dysgonamonadaceae bacterium]|nr:phosphoribosylglycinamide formyltransferase [Dysgonamonadaceae bacterium]
MIKIAVFASGNGSNAENIIRYFKDNEEIRVALIISNKANAYVHTRAKNWGVPSYTFSKDEFEKGDPILEKLREYQIDFIVLAGFLLKISDPILKAYPQRIINIHPALLPKYGGKGMYGDHVHKAVLQAGEKESGISIHYVNERYDEGDIIFQARCPVLPSDTPEELAQRIHKLEYEYYPQVIEKIAKQACKGIDKKNDQQ